MILKRKFWKYFLVFLVVGTGFGYLVGIMIENNVFREEAIFEKYCYYWEDDGLGEVFAAENIEKAYQIIAYFYCEKTKSQRGIILGEHQYSMGNEVKKVEVLGYTKDSLLARIRYRYHSSQRGGMILESECYVPNFTLHDTIPRGQKVSNRYQMRN